MAKRNKISVSEDKQLFDFSEKPEKDSDKLFEQIKKSKQEKIEPVSHVVLTSKKGVNYIISEDTYLRNKDLYNKDGFYLESDPVKIKSIIDKKLMRG